MYILGIGCFYHDSSAALLKDGMIVAAAQEERFTRKKHDTSFPINAINYCLESQGISIKNIDLIGFYEKPLLKFERVLYQHIENFPKSAKPFLKSMPSWLNEKLRVVRIVKKKLRYKGDILFIDHHLAHAAGGFLISPFEKAAVLTVDGVGEWTTTAYGFCEGNDIRFIKEIKFPSSLGLLYSTITAYLGFTVNNSEYKVMGLSAYGNMNRETNPYFQRLNSVIDIKNDGSYRLDMDYFVYHYADRMPSKKMCRLLGGPVRKKGDAITQRHKDIAAALQLLTEDVMTKMLKYIHKVTGSENIVLAGGVALNSVNNGKILKRTSFKNVWIQPDPGDGGTSIGAVTYIYNSLMGKERKIWRSAFLGPEFSDSYIGKFLEENKIEFSKFKNEGDLIKKTAKLIFDNNVVGWFQGKMEWGPRALGGRSILANPCNPEAKELLNTKVKHREKFRPFAPVVCAEEVQKYFECDEPLPTPSDFMLMVYPVKKEFWDKIPSVIHVDGSGRLQTIRREDNILYYDLIKAFERLSDFPILINTSFNIRGEPIVCTPHDAYKCMMGTEIDYLVIGNFLVKREDNRRHMWNSDKYVQD